MKLSKFGKKITNYSGILELMDDLGNALAGKEKKYMLGGGVPAHVPEMQKLFRKRMNEILNNKKEFENLISNYDTPQGNIDFLEAFAAFLRKQFGWKVTSKNLSIANGSQSAFFMLFNLLAGDMENRKKKKILLPILPEYIGYADQGISKDFFISCKPKFEIIDYHTFKYHIDFDKLKVTKDIAAICISRPTNPTGNVITDEEADKLEKLAKQNNIPLIIDNAYGAPFPNVMFSNPTLKWNENIVLSFSLSKLGLPASRTGIMLANEEIATALNRANSIISLAPGGIGQALVKPLLKDGEIVKVSNDYIQPFYAKKSKQTRKLIYKYFDDSLPYYIHMNEGSFFLWLWFKDFPIKSKELYTRLKKKNVIIVPGEYFFPGVKDKKWKHVDECIRINFGAASEEDIEHGIKVIGEEVKKAYN
jgi:valine--pyruvate aminotransferase|tara:strand:- start:4297 stop:5556 length:1260 start_codon:yes stop_codon:yes gene_type:complete